MGPLHRKENKHVKLDRGFQKKKLKKKQQISEQTWEKSDVLLLSETHESVLFVF